MPVFKAIEFKDKEFSSQEELFAELKANKDALIAMKKSEKTKSEEIIASIIHSKYANDKALALRDGYFYPVINTTNFLDSHKDVHIKGIWNKSAKEQQGKIYYLADHKKELGSIIAYPQDVEIAIRDLSWKDLGFAFEGNTQALIYIIRKDKIRLEAAKTVINDNIQMQNSVSMEYVNLALAINSKSPDFIEERATYDKYINEIVNKEDVKEDGYFWAVTEAKIRYEGSMVLFGSNPATPILQNKKIVPLKSTQTAEPPNSTQNNLMKHLLTN